MSNDFTDIPADNTNVRGLVYYEFLALGGACTIPISPYQEVASGADNEKFNGDYGTGVPALLTYEPEVIVDKTGNATVAEPGTITYNLPFYNNSTTAEAGLTLSSGGIYAPLTVQDTVPEGLEYVCNSAAITLDYGGTATTYYSTNGGSTWSTSQPAACPGTNPVSTAANPIVIR